MSQSEKRRGPAVTASGKWVRFVLVGSSAKTRIWNVLTIEGGHVLGQIRWFGRWRKYSFFPYPNTVYETDCLRDIAAYVEVVTEAHRKKP